MSGREYLVLDRVEKRFSPGDVVAVREVSLSIERGWFVSLLGPSGCGKTTTLRMIAGLETPTSGRILLEGNDVVPKAPADRDMAFVFQFYALYPHLSVFENVAFPLRAAGREKGEIETRVRAVSERLGLAPLLRKKPRQLSGGDMQRTALARALVRRPKAFLMDEPLGTLDARSRETMREELRTLHVEMGATTVYVTHDQSEAMSLSERIAVMSEGRVVQFGTPRDVYERPVDRFVAGFVGSPAMAFIEGRLVVPDARFVDPESGVSARAARPLEGSPSRGEVTLGVRPEHVRLGVPSAGAASFGVTVIHTEPLGSHNMVELAAGPARLRARVPSDVTYPDGADAVASLDPAGVHLFDTASGRSILAGQAALS
jgi:multiple sugar transport system ATP-binding protein